MPLKRASIMIGMGMMEMMMELKCFVVLKPL